MMMPVRFRTIALALAIGLTSPAVAQTLEDGAARIRPLAEQGQARWQNLLGTCYQSGIGGVSQDYAEALKWYRKAADQGLALAQNNLGVLYSRGDGVAQDDGEAYFWFNLAAASAEPGPVQESAASNRDLLAAKLAPERLAALQKRAREWRPTPPGA